MTVWGVDPGTAETAVVAYLPGIPWVGAHFTAPNAHVIRQIEHIAEFGCSDYGQDPRYPRAIVFEQIESMGMAVGREVFETVWYAGRMYDRAVQAVMRRQQPGPIPVQQLPRRPVKLHLCGSMRAKDANIRQALIDRFGGSKEAAIGSKAKPGPLYGVKAHEFAALAVAVTWWDQHAKGDDDDAEDSPTHPGAARDPESL